MSFVLACQCMKSRQPRFASPTITVVVKGGGDVRREMFEKEADLAGGMKKG